MAFRFGGFHFVCARNNVFVVFVFSDCTFFFATVGVKRTLQNRQQRKRQKYYFGRPENENHQTEKSFWCQVMHFYLFLLFCFPDKYIQGDFPELDKLSNDVSSHFEIAFNLEKQTLRNQFEELKTIISRPENDKNSNQLMFLAEKIFSSEIIHGFL